MNDAGEPAQTHPQALELRGVTAAYGKIQVLHGVDLTVREGEVMALLGPNGAGKSTTIKVASGQLPITTGEMRMAGLVMNGASTDALARAGVCTIPEGHGVFPSLTVRENLQMMSSAGTSMADIEAHAYDAFPRLKERRNQQAGSMSGGEQQMLAMARAFATDPYLVMLDELSMGLAPLIVAELYELVAGFAAQGRSVLVVEQFARTVLGVADRAAIMLHGRVSSVGRPNEIEEQLSAAYLGGDSGE